MKSFSIIVVFALLLISCAKERAYDEVYKSPKLTMLAGPTSPWDFNAEYLYLPSAAEKAGYASLGYSFMTDKSQIVKMRTTEAGIEVYSEDRDNNSVINERPILTIPGSYVSYRCAEDQNNDCTEREEVNYEQEWDQADNFIPSYESMTFHASGELDAYGSNPSFGSIKTGSKLIDVRYDSDGSINIDIENYYAIKDESQLWQYMMGSYDSINKTAFKLRYTYSFAKLDKLNTNGYSPVAYSDEEENRFGFFKTKYYDVDEYRQYSERVMANRWSPNRTITYYLSPEYTDKDDPYAKYFKEAAYKSIDVINEQLARGNVPLKLELKDPDPKVKVGDIRYNVLKLVKDHVTGSPLGYGPSFVNPRTGEIVSARVISYRSGLISSVSNVWEYAQTELERYFEMKQRAQAQSSAKSALKEQLKAGPKYAKLLKKLKKGKKRVIASEGSPFESFLQNKIIAKIHSGSYFAPKTKNIDSQIALLNQPFDAKLDKISEGKIKDLMNKASHHKLRLNPLLLDKSVSSKGIHSLLYDKETVEDKNYKQISDFMTKVEKNREYRAFLEEQGIDFAASVDNVQISISLLNILWNIPGAKDKRGLLRDWHTLSADVKEAAVAALIPSAYQPILIHEIGHNLGLRHNFYGSVDVKNFSKEQPTSSIMDYFSTFTDAVKYGTYDIAALQFMYNRRVELSPSYSSVMKNNDDLSKKYGFRLDDNSVSVSKDLVELEHTLFSEVKRPEVFRDYMYCTDQDKRKSLKCDAFDKGYTYSDITWRSIDNYKRSLKWNYRDSYPFISFGDFSESGSSRIFNYTLGRMRVFDKIREVASTYNTVFNFNPSGHTDEERKDVLNAVIMAKDFLIDTLTTPKQACLIQQVMPDMQGTNNGQPVISYQVEALEALYSQVKQLAESRQFVIDPNYVPKSCSDVEIRSLVNGPLTTQFRSQAKNYIKQQGVDATDEMLSLFSYKVAGEDGKPFRNMYKIYSSPNKENTMDFDQLSVRGMWIDRLIALDMLYRVGTVTPDGKYTSIRLIDIPLESNAGKAAAQKTEETKEKLSQFLKHLALPEKHENPYPRSIIDYTADRPVRIAYDNSFSPDDYSIPMTRDRTVNYYMGIYRSQAPLMESALEIVKRNRFENDLRELLVGRARSFGSVSSPEENIFKYGDYKFIVEDDNKFGSELLAYYKKSMIFADFAEELYKKETDPEKLQSAYITSLQETIFGKDLPTVSEMPEKWGSDKLDQIAALGYSSVLNLRGLLSSFNAANEQIAKVKSVEKSGVTQKGAAQKSSAELEAEHKINLARMVKEYASQTVEYRKSLIDQLEEVRRGPASDTPAEVVEVESSKTAVETVEEVSSETPAEAVEVESSETPAEVVEVESSETAVEVVEVESSETAVETVEEVSSETAVEVVEVESSDTPAEVVEVESSKTAVETVEEVSSETPAEAVEVESSETAVETVEEVSSETPAEAVEVESSETPAEVVEVESSETAVEVVEVESSETAVETVEEVSSETAVEVVEVESSDTPAEVVEVESSETAVEVVEVESSDTPVEVVEVESSETPAEVVEVESSETAVETVEEVSSEVLSAEDVEELVYNAISSGKLTTAVVDEMISFLDFEYIPEQAGETSKKLKGLKFEELINIFTKGPGEFYQNNAKVFSRLNYLPIIQ